jgi:hypothetical protein
LTIKWGFSMKIISNQRHRCWCHLFFHLLNLKMAFQIRYFYSILLSRCFFFGLTHLTRDPITRPGQWPGWVSKLWIQGEIKKKKKKRRKISMNKSLIAKWQNFRGQIKDDHFSWKKIAMFLNQLFILFLLILEETGSSKIAPNLIQNMDWIYLLTKPTSGLSFFHPHVAPPMQGWFVSNSLAMVPCFPQTWRNDPCLSSSPGSLSWER